MRTLLLFCLLTVGCGTQYQAQGWSGGYSDTQLAERVFEIRFAGNGYTHQSTVETYAMRRAAEITTARGFAGFVEVRDNTSTDESLVYYNNQPDVVSKHTTMKRIYLLTAEEMRATPGAIDARMILSGGAQSYTTQQPGQQQRAVAAPAQGTEWGRSPRWQDQPR